MNRVYEVIGIKSCSFRAQDGTEVTGDRLVVAQPIVAKGDGKDAWGVFVTSSKYVNQLRPVVGDQVHLYYNRWGKIEFVEVM